MESFMVAFWGQKVVHLLADFLLSLIAECLFGSRIPVRNTSFIIDQDNGIHCIIGDRSKLLLAFIYILPGLFELKQLILQFPGHACKVLLENSCFIGDLRRSGCS
ncbi:hypothetical protein ES708_20654 [subsurface metagenome]